MDGATVVIDLGPAGRIVLPVNGVPAQVGRPVELTVRPEKIEILTGQPATPRGSRLAGTVTEMVYLGTTTNYNIATSIDADVVVFAQNASSADGIAVRGDRVWLSWEPEHSYAIGAK